MFIIATGILGNVLQNHPDMEKDGNLKKPNTNQEQNSRTPAVFIYNKNSAENYNDLKHRIIMTMPEVHWRQNRKIKQSKYMWKLIELRCSQIWRKVILTYRNPGEKNPNSVRTMLQDIRHLLICWQNVWLQMSSSGQYLIIFTTVSSIKRKYMYYSNVLFESKMSWLQLMLTE